MHQLGTHVLISRSGHLLATDLDGEVVLMSIERGNYYGLEKTARRIWELLESPLTFHDLCQQLAHEYSARPEVIEADVGRFLTQLIEEDVVTVS